MLRYTQYVPCLLWTEHNVTGQQLIFEGENSWDNSWMTFWLTTVLHLDVKAKCRMNLTEWNISTPWIHSLTKPSLPMTTYGCSFQFDGIRSSLHQKRNINGFTPPNGKVVNRYISFLPVSKRVNFVGVIPDNDTTISRPHTFNCLSPR